MMSYDDALAAALEEVRAGADPRAVLARYPQHAERLRESIETAAAVRAARPVVVAPPAVRARASGAMQTALAQARTARAAPEQKAQSRSSLLSRLAPAFVALVLLLGVGVLAGPGGLFGRAGSAEASFEGIVVENSGGVITVETAAGPRRIAVEPSATATGADGVRVGLELVLPGQVVNVVGRKAGDGTVRSAALQLTPAEGAAAWCDLRPDGCAQIEQRLRAAVESCRPAAPACQALVERLRQLQASIAAQSQRLSAAEARCQGGDAAACKVLREFCAGHIVLCSNVRAAAEDGTAARRILRARYDSLKERCAADAAECQALRRFCAQEAAFCAAVKQGAPRDPVRP